MARFKPSPEFTAFLQAVGLVIYCSFVGILMLNANKWIPNPGPAGPTIFLILFLFSAIITSLIYLGFPFYLFWEKKLTAAAIKQVALITLWLIGFFLLGLLLILVTGSGQIRLG